VVAGLDVGHARSHFLHDARRLVAEDHGQRELPVAVHDVPVAVADPRGLDTHARLARLRSLLLEVHDLQRLVRLVQDGSFHLLILLVR
jgi:hypothetical protein